MRNPLRRRRKLPGAENGRHVASSSTTRRAMRPTPEFENARVSDAMRHGVITCLPDSPVRDVAATMAQHHIHSVIVTGIEGAERDWGMVSDVDVLRATGGDIDERTASEIAVTELVTVSTDERLDRAAQLMGEHEVTHLLVVDPQSRRPLGVLSTIDVAGILAWGRE
jgi:CBS domain-containing protein